jgi:hypothetical protein
MKTLKVSTTTPDGTRTPFTLDYGMSTPDIQQVYIQLGSFSINNITSMLKLEFRLGAYDIKGLFHPHPLYPTGIYIISAVKDPDFWKMYVMGRTQWDLDAMLDWLVAAGAVPKVAERFWNIPNLVVEVVTL